jgi:hypothetical protein
MKLIETLEGYFINIEYIRVVYFKTNPEGDTKYFINIYNSPSYAISEQTYKNLLSISSFV